jgi:hypothetical protein
MDLNVNEPIVVGYSIRTLNELFNIHICFLLDFSEKLFLKTELLIWSEKTLVHLFILHLYDSSFVSQLSCQNSSYLKKIPDAF